MEGVTQDPEVVAMNLAVVALNNIEDAIRGVEGDARTDVLQYVEKRIGRTLATYRPAKATRNGKRGARA
jgi:hypothetical protein